jgi:hypothetical protein
MRLIAAMVAAILTCVPANASSLDAVESKLFTLRDLKLDSGATLPEVTIAYETYGALAADGRNAVLITHSLTSSHHAAGKSVGNLGALALHWVPTDGPNPGEADDPQPAVRRRLGRFRTQPRRHPVRPRRHRRRARRLHGRRPETLQFGDPRRSQAPCLHARACGAIVEGLHRRDTQRQIASTEGGRRSRAVGRE